MGPAKIACLTCLTDFIVAARAAPGRVDICIGTYLAPVDETCARVHRHSVRVAVAHRVDLGTGLRRALREKVSLGDGIRPVRLRVNSNDLAAQVIRVCRRFLCVPWSTARPLVDGSVTRREGIRVVAGGEIEVAFAVEGDGASGVTALLTLNPHLEENFPRREVERVALHLEASEHIFRLGSGGRVEHVDPAIPREPRVYGEPEKAVLCLTAVGVF